MKKRLLLLLLVFVMVVSVLPSVGAKTITETEGNPAAFGGSLNTTTDLLFDFSNKTADQTRYKASAYGGYNFDQETNGYWATGYNSSKSDYSISNTNGTLRVNVTGGADASGVPGPWIKVTNKYGTLPSYNEASRPYYPLNFKPTNVKAVTIRFKLSGCSAPAGQIPKIVFEYYYTKNGTYSYANDMWASFTLDNGYYQTVTIPVSSKLTSADVLKGFGFRFRNVKATSGTIYIDHIYIGASAGFVLSNHSDKTFHSQSVNPILSGVNEAQVYLKNKTDGNPIAGYIATIAPSAKVTFKASYPGYYAKGSTVESRKTAAPKLPFKGATTTAQAASYETATGETVYLAINADFFNMETFQPRGQLVLEGNTIQTYGTRATPYFAVLKDGTFAIRAFGTPMGDVEEAVAGYHWLVRDGAVVTNDDVELAPRTAIGLKADGTVIVFATDGRQEGYSMGLTIQDTGELMKNAGCVNAINLDGGGSTTFATRYSNGDSALKIRNSPSDNTGERVVTSSLLLVAAPCEHKFGGSYTRSANGTHTTSCSACGKTITVTHSYQNGVCACGDRAHLGDGLYFGFGNSAADNYRYTDPAYNYFNYDMTNDGKWYRGYWATGYNGDNRQYTINNAGGTLTVNVTDGFSGTVADGNQIFGPWLKITNGHGVQPNKNVDTFVPLNYDPANVDIVQIRFKLTGCQVPTGTTPKVVFEYYYNKNGAYTGSADMAATYTFKEGEYLTVTMPASKNLTSADVLRGFGFRFQNIKSTSGGKLIVDYIYIGEKQDETLIFNFDNSSASKLRYQNIAYNFYNFDTVSNGYWSTGYNDKNTNFTVNNSDGTLNVAVTDGYSSNSAGENIIYGPWVKTTNTYGKFTGQSTYDYYPLSYDPKNAEFFQIRFKTTDCIPDSGKNPRVVLEYYYTKDGAYAYANDILATYTWKNGEYQTLTVPVTAKFKAADEILCFGLRFQHIRSSSGGSVSIDYIAIGKNEELPTPKYTVTFKGADGSILQQQTLSKGENAVYSGSTPTKAPDEKGHYTFSGWDKPLTNITSDTVITAQFAVSAHSYRCVYENDTTHRIYCDCGYKKYENHTVVIDAAVPPTCTVTGLTEGKYCSTCKAYLVPQEIVPAKGHTEVIDKAVAPTCTQSGKTEGKHCSVCNIVLISQNVVPAKGHTEVIDKAVVPTCTETGLTEGKHCTVCSAVLVAQETVAATGHDPIYTPVDNKLHRVTCNRCTEMTEAPHSYQGGICICGEKEIKDPIEYSTLRINHNLNLASDISVNLLVSKSLLTGFDMDTVYVESAVDTYTGNEKTGTKVIRIAPVDKGDYYYFTLTGLTAVNMMDKISSVLYGTKDGQPYYSPVDEYSIATYAYSQLNNLSRPESLKILCADLLRYGAKAQIFKSYRTDALAEAEMTQAHKAYLSDMDAVTFGNTNRVLDDLNNAPVAWIGKALNLESKVELKFIYQSAGYTGDLTDLILYVSYEDANGKEKSIMLRNAELYNEERNFYAFTLDTLLAAELRTVVSVQIYNGDVPVSATLQYSADTYGNKKEGALLDLCKALFAYSDSAKAFFTA